MRVAWACLVWLLASCGPSIQSGGLTVDKSTWLRADRELRHRAAVDLDCGAAAVQLTLVQMQGRFPTAVHASGCGSQAVYSRRLRRRFFVRTDKNTQWSVEANRIARW